MSFESPITVVSVDVMLCSALSRRIESRLESVESSDESVEVGEMEVVSNSLDKISS